jgi:hypothetical protein
MAMDKTFLLTPKNRKTTTAMQHNIYQYASGAQRRHAPPYESR